MYDKPSASQLLDTVSWFLQEQILPLLKDSDPRRYYETLITINALKIARREAAWEMTHLREEWGRLNFIQQVNTPLPDNPNAVQTALAERNRRLCDDIAAGLYDYWPRQAALFEHLLMTTRAQLEVTDPDFLAQLAQEDSRSNT
ncbi:MAG: hypothetical protein H6672_02700 [Anaerolineaceae bacterium]|nr:hypothetical protein [Anaerolineaceae bacterium]